MIFKWVYGILPAFVSYMEVDREVKNYASGWRIVIQPQYKCDCGILEHELQHVRQWYRGGLFIHTLRYGKSIKYRLKCEIEAYLKQMKYSKCDGSFLTMERAAECLTWDRYGFDLTKEEILAILKITDD